MGKHHCNFTRAMALCCMVVALLCGRIGAQETGKALVLPSLKPDLEITGFSHKGVFTVGNKITFYWGVRNASLIGATSSHSDCIYLSNSRSFSTNGTVLHCQSNRSSLGAKGGYTQQVTITLPQVPAGNYYLWVATDTGGKISEASESNNYMKYGPVAVAVTGIPPRVLPELNLLHVSSTGGSDISGLGTPIAPLKELDAALQHAAQYAEAENPVRVRVSSGIYTNAIALPRNVQLVGANPLDPRETIIRPVLGSTETGGAGILISEGEAVIRDVTLQVDPETKGFAAGPLLKVSNAKVVMDNVIFEGSGKPGSVGLATINAAGAGTVLTRCEFRGLERGIEITGAAPNISRNIFRDIAGDAIIINAVAGVAVVPRVGNANDPTSGFNYFENVGGFFINNLSGNLVVAEWNDFGGIPFDMLPGFFNGPVDHDPSTVVYSLQSSMLVTVLDADTQDPIYNAEVGLQPNALPGLFGNVDGVYPFALVPPGNYTVSVSAPGYYAAEEEVVVPVNQPITSVTVYLLPDGAEPKTLPLKHNSDSDQDDQIDLSELLRVTQLFNAPGLRCLAGTEDGYAPGYGDTASCDPHVADYNAQNWRISLSELLRVIQLYTIGAYHLCEESEDGYCPGPA